MVDRWGWTGIEFLGPLDVKLSTCDELFDSPQAARNNLQFYLELFNATSTEAKAAEQLRTVRNEKALQTIVICPPHAAWAVYAVSEGYSTDQGGRFFYDRERENIRSSLIAGGPNKVLVSQGGCAVVALAGLGLATGLVVAWSRTRWGA